MVENFKFHIEEKDYVNFSKTDLTKEIDNFPVVYLIHNDEKMYVGETSNIYSRVKAHQKDLIKQESQFKKIKVISSNEFNKSATYEIETKLLEYMLADEKYILINTKLTQNAHEYYQKSKYQNEIFVPLWEKLKEIHLAKNSLRDIENKEIFKYSPFKSFSSEQQYIVEDILRRVNDEDMSISLVDGEPGTGKILLLIKIAHDLIFNSGHDPKEMSKRITIVLPQKGLHKIYKRIFKRLGINNKDMIITGTHISKMPRDILLIDEAHRLKKYFSKQSKDLKHLRDGNDNYIDELELAYRNSKHLIICYDKDQTIRPADIDHNDRLHKILNESTYNLTTQFRISLGRSYLTLIKNILQIDYSEKLEKFELGDYEFKIFDSVEELHAKIKEKNNEYGLSRIASGYSWFWESNPASKRNRNKQNHEYGYDIVDNNYKLRWNSNITDWVHSKNAIEEVGSIHTLQGVDLNYIGVIIGDDITYNTNTGKIEAVKSNYYDEKGKPVKGTDKNDEELTKYIKNIYYVLLTRGIRGTYIYFKDQNMREHFKKIMNEFVE